MKKVIFTILVLVNSFFASSQDLEYYGPINENILLKLTPDEIVMYIECVGAIGMHYEVFNWAPKEVVEKYKKNKKQYQTLLVNIEDADGKPKVSGWPGSKVFGKDYYIFYVKRQKNKSIVKLYSLS